MTPPDSSFATASQTRSQHALNFVLWLLVLAPVLGCALLVRKYCINQRFLDDWVWAMDLTKLAKGEFTLHDLVAVHFEHRPALPKAFALAVTWLAKGDVAAQCALGFCWYVGSFACLVRLWLKRGCVTLREAWMPLFLSAAIIFTPVQWQNLLWPICCETVLPMMFLLIALCLCGLQKPWWVLSLALAGCGMAAMLSFASGVLVWVLPLPVLLFCGPLKTFRERRSFFALWGGLLAVFLALYFWNFHNEVPSAYAYGHGKEGTMSGELMKFLDQPWVDVQFVAAFCGALFVRGWAMDTKTAAEASGWCMIVLLILAALYAIRHWKDRELRSILLPLLCFSLYTPVTGLMVAVGRAAGGVGVALNTRYHVHQSELLLSLVALGFFILRHAGARVPDGGRKPWAVVGFPMAGLVAGVIGVGWIYGDSMMEEWQSARGKDAAAQRLAFVFPNYTGFTTHITGLKFTDTLKAIRDLDDLRLLSPAPLKDRSLSNFRINPHPLGDGHGQFERLYKDASGWKAQGTTSLPRTWRKPDAILFTYRKPGETQWTIFAYTQVSGVPQFLTRGMGKDLWAIRTGDPWPDELWCAWDRDIALAEEPPPGSRIKAWALNALTWEVAVVSRKLGKDPHKDDDGEPVETISTLIRQQD